MVLSVLSGEKPVTTAVEELGISRGLYYQLETRALQAMLQSLAPGPDGTKAQAGSPAERISELEAKVEKLERDKRRGERLLLLTRKTLASSVKTGRGRRTKRRVSSTPGPGPSPKPKPKSTTSTSMSSSSSKGEAQPGSTPTMAGGSEAP
jgi:hypothetical protein